MLAENGTDQVNRIGYIAGQQRHSLDAVDTAGSSEPITDGKQRNGQHGHDQDVPRKNLRPYCQRVNGPCNSDHRQGIEQVGAEHISQCDVVLFPPGRDNRRRQLRQGSANCDDGQANDQITDPETVGNLNRPPHQDTGAGNQ